MPREGNVFHAQFLDGPLLVLAVASAVKVRGDFPEVGQADVMLALPMEPCVGGEVS